MVQPFYVLLNVYLNGYVQSALSGSAYLTDINEATVPTHRDYLIFLW